MNIWEIICCYSGSPYLSWRKGTSYFLSSLFSLLAFSNILNKPPFYQFLSRVWNSFMRARRPLWGISFLRIRLYLGCPTLILVLGFSMFRFELLAWMKIPAAHQTPWQHCRSPSRLLMSVSSWNSLLCFPMLVTQSGKMCKVYICACFLLCSSQLDALHSSGKHKYQEWAETTFFMLTLGLRTSPASN